METVVICFALITICVIVLAISIIASRYFQQIGKNIDASSVLFPPFLIVAGLIEVYGLVIIGLIMALSLRAS